MGLALIDTHCHLDFDIYEVDRNEVIERAHENGVIRFVTPGIDCLSSGAVLTLAEKFPEIYPAIGIHPNSNHDLREVQINCLRKLKFSSKVVAIGEIGLDYYRDNTPRDLQVLAFESQLKFAAEKNLPVIIHNRNASRDLFKILENWMDFLIKSNSILCKRPGVLHSFDGTLEDAQKAMDMNFFIGISGPVTFRNSKSIQNIISQLPLTSVIIETDAPFLTPHPMRGKRNEPAYVLYVAEKIAQLKNKTVELVADITTKNAMRLFNWSEIP